MPIVHVAYFTTLILQPNYVEHVPVQANAQLAYAWDLSRATVLAWLVTADMSEEAIERVLGKGSVVAILSDGYNDSVISSKAYYFGRAQVIVTTWREGAKHGRRVRIAPYTPERWTDGPAR
jgi:hypothetical protein